MTHVFMGVAGCGKSEVGKRVAAVLGLGFADADDLHPAANVAKMAGGTPLTDADREPWLAAVAESIASWSLSGGAVLACSALRKRYRDRLREGGQLGVVHLCGDLPTIAARMAARQNHFMPTSLLESQFATLENPAGEPWTDAVDIAPPLDSVVAAAVLAVRKQRAAAGVEATS